MDLVICSGTVVDGTGAVPVPGDVAVADGADRRRRPDPAA